jgi:amidophosphoribosyltransferase
MRANTEMIEGKRLLFCEDSIVRGTQLKNTIRRLYDSGALEVHMRTACPPLVYACKFLNFSRSHSEMDLAARQAINELEGENVSQQDLGEYARQETEKYYAMEDRIRKRLNLTTLKYQYLEDLVQAINLPWEKLCTYCWNGKEIK